MKYTLLMLLLLSILITLDGLCRSSIKQRKSLSILSHSPSQSQLSSQQATTTTTTSSSSSVLSASAFIAGTTIGGGFLALPLTTRPIGFIPSIIGLVLSWLYLLGSALSLSKATINIMNKNQTLKNTNTISVFTIARETFGNTAAILSAGLFLILMLSTLIAQLSKIGVLLPSLGIFNKEIAILFFASFMSLLTFGKGIQFAERINNILTLIMMISFGSIIAAAPGSGFDFSRLYRSNFRSLLPFNHQSSVSWAIPVFLQLLVYTETIPLVVSRLNGDEIKIKKALIIGSSVPLLMCIIWTMIAIGLVPTDLSIIDPVDILLKNSPSKRIKSSLLLLTLSAVSTTVIGSCLTISQFLDDLMKDKKILSKLLSIAPATLIAATGSQSLYYTLTRFAGAFPVTFLWGLCPPIFYLKSLPFNKGSRLHNHNYGQYFLILISISMLFINLM